jgi:predicted DNA-binding transcriptional regulator YafY
MATNKNAIKRYQALNRCFRNPGRKYFIEDLIEICTEALLDVDPHSSGIKRRQLFDDIKFMKDPRGFDAPIESFPEGRKRYYRYTDCNFSINNQPLNEQEAQQLKESLLTLSRFKGMPQFEWVEEMQARLEQSFKLKTEDVILSFEENKYLTGRQYIGDVYNSIVNKKVLNIDYKPFGKDLLSYEIHPYHLKQYNNRWFLFGLNNQYNNITNIPLDRIQLIEVSNEAYVPNDGIDFAEYFEDVIGVTIPADEAPQKVLLKISAQLWPYIQTKPIHESQKIKEITTEFTLIQLEVYLNYEMEAQIFSRGEQIEVLEPIALRNKIKQRAEALVQKYL